MSAEKIRTIAVFALALGLLLAFAVIRPLDQHGVAETKFWNQKFTAPAEFDIVAAGDSRILHGIDGTAFKEAGLGSCLNFGFRGTGLNADYLQSAQDRLSEQGKRILVLGITPNNFTPNSAVSSGFTQKRDDVKASKYSAPAWYGDIERRMQPAKLAEISRFARGRKNPRQETLHLGGWSEAAHNKPDEDYALRYYKVRFDNNAVQPQRIDDACQFLKTSIENGVRVFAFKPPVSESMTQLENEKSGFDYAEFIDKFSQVGGVWIDVDAAKFKTYDGSHLESASAREFSQWLAVTIKSRVREGD